MAQISAARSKNRRLLCHYMQNRIYISLYPKKVYFFITQCLGTVKNLKIQMLLTQKLFQITTLNRFRFLVLFSLHCQHLANVSGVKKRTAEKPRKHSNAKIFVVFYLKKTTKKWTYVFYIPNLAFCTSFSKIGRAKWSSA